VLIEEEVYDDEILRCDALSSGTDFDISEGYAASLLKM
jgi:hypothetical protein